MKEIDIHGIIMKNFGHRMSGIKYKEYPTIYDALHSSEYRKVSQRNFGAIYEGFNVAEIEFYYLKADKPVQMKVIFDISFDFEYAERVQHSFGEYGCGEKFSVKPELNHGLHGIDDISIELDELSPVNKEVYKLLWDNVPFGGGGDRDNFRYRCISGMHCEGHGFRMSHVILKERIVNFFNYLFGIVDEAYEYQKHPEKRPRIFEVEQTSYYEENDIDDEHEYKDYY